MELRGERGLAAPREAVFAAIHDPDRLLAAIPGCESVERVSDTEYRGRIALRLPAVGGTYAMTIWLVESVAPESCLLDGEVEGRTGRAAGRVAIRLAQDGDGTRLSWEADARLGGPLAWLDSALVARVASSIIDQGLARLADSLAGDTVPDHIHDPQDAPDQPRPDRNPSNMETLV